MPNEVDKSLLDRLQALRGSSEPPERVAPRVDVDVIERRKTPTREDALAERLKLLRDGGGAPSQLAAAKDSPPPYTPRAASLPAEPKRNVSSTRQETSRDTPSQHDDEKDVDTAFQTDDQTLEELLGDVGDEETFAVAEPDDDKVKALLEELSSSIPQDKDRTDSGDDDDDDDDSDGEVMNRKVDETIARLRDEMEVEAKRDEEDEDEGDEAEENDDIDDAQPRSNDGQDRPSPQGHNDATDDSSITLPSVPTDLSSLSTPPTQAPPSSSLTDLTARMAALRSSPSSPPPRDNSLSLPSVPSSKPSPGKPIKRLTSRTNYTDDDVDSWCTVCLEDATLRCLGCDEDPYCSRCWREMHVGPAAAFDDRSHRAVQFTREKGKKKREEGKRKVALGA